MTRTQSISGSVLVVAASADADALAAAPALAEAGLEVERAPDADAAIARFDEDRERPDVILLMPPIADPVRVAQRLHSLDRDGAVLVMAEPGGEADLSHALQVAPFLEGDVSMVSARDTDRVVDIVASAAARTQDRREAGAVRHRHETPPPLSARYLGTLLDSVPIGLVTLDESGRVIGWNKRAGDMLAIAEVEALGSSFSELFAPDSARLERLIGGLTTRALGSEGQVFERGGRSFEITGARFAIRSGEGGSLLILQDVTKRKAAEREVELQRALMAAQADSSEVGIAVVTLDGELERINKRWTEIWGIDADTIRNDRARAMKAMTEQVVDPDAFVAGAERLAATGDGDYRDDVVRKDGRVIERYATHVRNEAGVVIGRIWFHTDITAHRREEDALRFLADASNLLSSSLDYEETLQRVAELAVPRIADSCTVEMAGHGFGSGPVGRVVETGEPLVLRDLPDERLIVPIKVRDRVFGAITFVRGAPSPRFDHDDLALATELARRAAFAIDNARVNAELRDTARTLQESLLPPHLPAAHGLELAARFRPASEGVEVGGDFYDIFETGPQQWTIAVGDVCGKGAEAAALTALTRYTVRAAAMYENEPSGVLRVLNEALLRQRGDYRFTTLALCVVDLAGERPSLHVACGGHPRPLLLRPDGTVQAVGATGPLLGVVPDAEFHVERVALEDDDALVLYTDGLTDALAPQRMLDEDGLLAALADCRGLSAGLIALRLEEAALAGDPGAVPRDDIALVVAKLG